MDEIFEQLQALRARESRIAMATLVGAHGTTPKKEGAKMWVGEGGRILGSVTIGGCVDARVVAESEGVLHEGRTRLVSMELGDEDAWEMGLTCGGTVDVLIERLELRNDAPAVAAYDLAAAEHAAGHRVVVASVIDDGAIAPGSCGARLLIREDGTTALSLGDAALDEAVRNHASALLRAGTGSRLARVPGASGEGEVDVFFELLAPALTMLIVGATQLGIALARLAQDAGFRTVVIDPRERFATPERFPEVHELRVGMASEIVASMPLSPTTAVALVAHDYKIELPVLRVVLRSGAAYVGVLGSRRRGAALREQLADELTPDELARIHLPIGLDIGARSTNEIALAIVAEAVAVARGRPGGVLSGAR